MWIEWFLLDRKFCFRIVCLNLSRAGTKLITWLSVIALWAHFPGETWFSFWSRPHSKYLEGVASLRPFKDIFVIGKNLVNRLRPEKGQRKARNWVNLILFWTLFYWPAGWAKLGGSQKWRRRWTKQKNLPPYDKLQFYTPQSQAKQT